MNKHVQLKEIIEVDVENLKSNPLNAREHSKKQIKQIGNCIRNLGFRNPIQVDENNVILAGHGRFEAAKWLNMKKVPVIRHTDLNEAEKMALLIADNKTAEESTWDITLLVENFEILSELDCSFDQTVTGFESYEIDTICEKKELTDEVEETVYHDSDNNEPPVTKVGYVWILGNHKVYCGNSLDEQSYKILMGEDITELVVTDYPYNVPINGHVSGLGETKHGDFKMGCGEMSREQFIDFLITSMQHMHDFSCLGALFYFYMDWRHVYELISAGEDVFGELKQLCVWAKENAGMGAFYRSRHELVCIFKKAGAEHINNFELGQHGRYRSNVWEYPGMNSTSPTSRQLLKLHPTVKPVAMLADILLDASKPNGIVLDPFGGSGSTLIAAEHTNRRARLIELDPKYVDVIIQRWQAYTGQDAVLESTGQTFAEVSAEQK